jgi:hypothetical protein
MEISDADLLKEIRKPSTKPQLERQLKSLATGPFFPFEYELEDYCNGLVDVKEMARLIRLAMAVYQYEEFQNASIQTTVSFIRKYCRLHDEKNLNEHSLVSALFHEILTKDEAPEVTRTIEFFKSKSGETLAA